MCLNGQFDGLLTLRNVEYTVCQSSWQLEDSKSPHCSMFGIQGIRSLFSADAVSVSPVHAFLRTSLCSCARRLVTRDLISSLDGSTTYRSSSPAATEKDSPWLG
jgi:hypothetical protein